MGTRGLAAQEMVSIQYRRVWLCHLRFEIVRQCRGELLRSPKNPPGAAIELRHVFQSCDSPFPSSRRACRQRLVSIPQRRVRVLSSQEITRRGGRAWLPELGICRSLLLLQREERPPHSPC